MITEDVEAVKRALPAHYSVTSGEKDQHVWIRCRSKTGITTGNDRDDEEHWGYIMGAFRKHFGDRFMEVYHNTCYCHVDFVVYARPQHLEEAHKS